MREQPNGLSSEQQLFHFPLFSFYVHTTLYSRVGSLLLVLMVVVFVFFFFFFFDFLLSLA
jgi:hypothetical protein